jgi:hypothetical protein
MICTTVRLASDGQQERRRPAYSVYHPLLPPLPLLAKTVYRLARWNLACYYEALPAEMPSRHLTSSIWVFHRVHIPCGEYLGASLTMSLFLAAWYSVWRRYCMHKCAIYGRTDLRTRCLPSHKRVLQSDLVPVAWLRSRWYRVIH